MNDARRRCALRPFVAIAFLALPLQIAWASVYKCTDANGKVSYQEQPCPATAQGRALNSDSTRASTQSPAQAANWISVFVKKTSIEDGIGKELFLDRGNVRSFGTLRRAHFKWTYFTDVPSTKFIYHFYDCTAGTASLAFSEAGADDVTPERARAFLQPYETHTWGPPHEIAFASPDVVALVCGAAAR